MFNEEHNNQSTNNEIETSTQEHQTTSKKEKKTGIGKLISVAVLSGLTATLLTFLLLSSNILTSATHGESSNESGQQQNVEQDSGISDKIFSSDDASVTSNLNELSEAVVGVVNIQKKNIFDQGSQAGTGSGIIYKKDGSDAYVITNQHVIEGAKEVEVALNKDKRVDAEVVGEDSLTDLAVLKISAEHVSHVAQLGESDHIKVGDSVVAIGNPLGLEFSNSVTKGIISGLNRSLSVDTNGDRQPDWVTEVIQTDAAINPGNSGGALVNEKGEVIGINSMKIAQQQIEGMGFAIPINQAKKIINEIEEHGEVKRPLVGISAVSLGQVPKPYDQNIQVPNDLQHGLVIAEVGEGSPAGEAGLQQYDIVTHINDQEVKNILDLKTYLYNQVQINDQVELTIYRDGEKQTVQLTLDETI